MIGNGSYLVICGPAQHRLVSTVLPDSVPVSLITDEGELEALTPDNAAAFDGAVVVAEIPWPGHTPDELFGLDVAVALRMRLKMLAPICILSFLPRSFFLDQPETKFNILKARGTAFVRLPVENDTVQNALNGVLPLSDATLVYLSNLLVDIQHLIDHLRHVFRMKSSHEVISASVKKLDILSSSTVYPRARELADGILSAHEEVDEDRFYGLAAELLSLLGTCRQDAGEAQVQEEGNRQTVVVVDDNPDDLDWAVSALRQAFHVIPFRTALEAKRLIDGDVGNEIAAVICDWQLLRPGTDEQQEMLGFELLDYAARKGHYALFSLTSTDDASTLEVDQHLWFEHTLISKDFHHDAEMWKLYIPIIRQKIERNRAVIASLPTGEGWSSNFKLAYRKENGKTVAYRQYYTSLKEQYVKKRNSEGWHSFEADVSCVSDKLWDYYRKAMIPEERPLLFDLKMQWGLELNRDLRNVLVIRRLFLALWFNKTRLDISFKVPGKGLVEDPVINIYSVLRHRYFSEIMDEREEGYDAGRVYKDLSNAAKVFASQLAIEPNRLPQGILPEEKAWLAIRGIDDESGNDNLYYPD